MIEIVEEVDMTIEVMAMEEVPDATIIEDTTTGTIGEEVMTADTIGEAMTEVMIEGTTEGIDTRFESSSSCLYVLQSNHNQKTKIFICLDQADKYLFASLKN
jgi:hypothetical protein